MRWWQASKFHFQSQFSNLTLRGCHGRFLAGTSPNIATLFFSKFRQDKTPLMCPWIVWSIIHRIRPPFLNLPLTMVTKEERVLSVSFIFEIYHSIPSMNEIVRTWSCLEKACTSISNQINSLDLSQNYSVAGFYYMYVHIFDDSCFVQYALLLNFSALTLMKIKDADWVL